MHPGQDLGTARSPTSPLDLTDLERLEEAAGLTARDGRLLALASEILAPYAAEVVDTWRALLAPHSQLAAYSSHSDGSPDPDYAAASHPRFTRWIIDICTRPRDQAWLDYQHEIGRLTIGSLNFNATESRDGAPDLVWLPHEPPTNARVVLSTLPGRALNEVRRRRWKTFGVRPLDRRESRELIVSYLAQYAKTLPTRTVVRIAEARPAANPMFLRSMLEELRIYGDHEKLEPRVSELLAAGGRRGRSADAIPKLFESILSRWEGDYERDRPGLVRDAMTLLWAARRGLSESELL